MTPEEFKKLRIRVFQTQKQCADKFEYHERQVQRWEAGKAPIPWVVQRLIIAMDDGLL